MILQVPIKTKEIYKCYDFLLHWGWTVILLNSDSNSAILSISNQLYFIQHVLTHDYTQQHLMVSHWPKLGFSELQIEITKRCICTFHCCQMLGVLLDRWEGTQVPNKQAIVIAPRCQILIIGRPFQTTNLYTTANHMVIQSHYQS
jgi:hypothetical protein